MSEIKEMPGFVTFPLSKWHADVALPVLLYVYMPQNNKMLIYRQVGSVLDRSRIEQMSKNPERFFVRYEDQKTLEDFIANLNKPIPSPRVVGLVQAQKSGGLIDGKTPLQVKSAEVLMKYFKFEPDPTSKLSIVEQANQQIHQAIDDVFEILEADSGMLAKVKDLQKKANYQEWNHPVNVSAIATLFALSAGYTDKKLLRDIATAGYLHDIGLMNCNIPIPRRNLKYNKEQMGRYHYHPIASLEMIETLEMDVSEEVKLIVYQHEEKYDGGGYPMNVSGPDIFEPAQILAIANRFDHLIRVDEPGWLKADEALRKIGEENSIHGQPSPFNPILLNQIFEAAFAAGAVKLSA